MTQRVKLSGLIAVGFQTMSLANSTAIGVNSTCRTGNTLHISVETNAARYRADGSDPTLTTGVLLPKDLAPFVIEGYNYADNNVVFQRSTGTSKVSLMSYRRV